MAKHDLEKLTELVAQCSPFGKIVTPHSMFKAYAASMCIALNGIGLTREEIVSVFKDTHRQTMQEKAFSEILDLIVTKTKPKSKNQETDQNSDQSF